MSGEDIESLRRAIEANARPRNSYWAWRDKPIAERGAADTILRAAGLRVDRLVSRGEGQDPPDCEGMVDGLWSGIEVTELVHRETLEQSITAIRQRNAGRESRLPVAYFEWARGDLLAALQELINGKDKADLKGGPYDQYILVIHTDEFFLLPDTVARYVEGAIFDVKCITQAYLGLSYRPDTAAGEGGHPAFRLSLVRA
ncbi:hypothetical protein [Reyranella sp. CPCC 100927]|uniref:hypothetical protein n=1 Tax=Reyranella sp. CPCC 100927 TaxID=2599616 RepID=UPI0011B7E5B0|nr:hypothetical protein [Reyranella sp. CPCC 100927]TWT02928.1 hypothetical protein FQU96_30000 [Reyranella sp. CPCC 100927]